MGGTSDHVHILMALPPKLSVAQIVRVWKANSSEWMNESGHLFAWQQGYGCSVCRCRTGTRGRDISVGKRNIIGRSRNQEEFVEFLWKHGIVTESGKEME
jgi:REP element-mobilizing transposase RayT